MSWNWYNNFQLSPRGGTQFVWNTLRESMASTLTLPKGIWLIPTIWYLPIHTAQWETSTRKTKELILAKSLCISKDKGTQTYHHRPCQTYHHRPCPKGVGFHWKPTPPTIWHLPIHTAQWETSTRKTRELILAKTLGISKDKGTQTYHHRPCPKGVGFHWKHTPDHMTLANTYCPMRNRLDISTMKCYHVVSKDKGLSYKKTYRRPCPRVPLPSTHLDLMILAPNTYEWPRRHRLDISTIQQSSIRFIAGSFVNWGCSFRAPLPDFLFRLRITTSGSRMEV